MEASRLAPTPKPITMAGSSRTRSDCSGMRSGCSGERKCRYGSSHSPDLKSGTFERAAPTAADPKEKMPSGCVGGCFGDGSPSRTGDEKVAPKLSFPLCPTERFPGHMTVKFPHVSHSQTRASDEGTLGIPTGVAFPAVGRPGGRPCRICSNTAVNWTASGSYECP